MQSLSVSPESRPVIFNYRSISKFLAEMMKWRRQQDTALSVRKLVQEIPGCSPSLVTQVIQGKRKLTRERVETFSKLLKLTRHETTYLDRWVENERSPSTRGDKSEKIVPKQVRGQPQNHLLSDWVNLYVKDACGLVGFEPNPETIFRLLGGMVPIKRIERSFKFLLREGFLRTDVNGRIVKNFGLTTTTDDVPSAKIRQFHKQALQIAARAIDIYPVEKRRANAIVLALDQSSVPELELLLKDFYEKLMAFTEQHTDESENLYQVLINFAPVGGSHDR